jgi:hypothetical protein
MLNAGRLFTALCPLYAKVAEPGGDGDKIHMDFIRAGGNEFVNSDADHASGKIMLLLAGDLTGMATGAPIILYKQTVTRHGYSFPPLILTMRQRLER